jgi:hypothetical protein
MVQVASAATCVPTRLVSRGACRVTAIGLLAETAVDGPRRAGDMYQNPVARLWLIEDTGKYKPTLLRTGEPGTTEVAAFLSQDGSAGCDPHQRRLGGLWRAIRSIPARGEIMAATDTSSVSTPPVPPAGAPSEPESGQPPVPPKIAALLAGLTALSGAVIGLITSFNAVHWTSAQTTLVAAEVAAFWALAGAVTAHLWPQTKKQPVAVAGTVTAFVSATLSLGIGFAWWQLTQSQNASLISLVTAIVAVASALAARSTVTADTTPAR